MIIDRDNSFHDYCDDDDMRVTVNSWTNVIFIISNIMEESLEGFLFFFPILENGAVKKDNNYSPVWRETIVSLLKFDRSIK